MSVLAFGAACSVIGCFIGGFIGFEAGKDHGWFECEDYYKPMLDRCRKYDESAQKEKANG